MVAPLEKRTTAGWLALEWLPRVLVAALFAYTGITKIIAPETFIQEVRAYELAPLITTNLVAFILPWLEVLAALSLLAGLWRREGRVGIAGMLFVFILAKSILLAQGKQIDCGCVPTDSFLHFLFDGWTGVVTNVCLLAFLGIEGCAETLRRTRRELARTLERAAAAPAHAVA
jgi:uncharacterized membrane protein